MSKRHEKTVFVCCGSLDEKVISKTIEANTQEEAKCLFEKEFLTVAIDCHGPFTQKKIIEKISYTNVKLSGESKSLIYNNWFVKALFTNEPQDCAYLIFDRRVDGKKMPKPQETIIVKKEHLKELK